MGNSSALTRAHDTMPEAFERDGYLSPIDVLSADEVREFRACFAAHRPRLDGRFGARYKHKTHLMLRWVDALVHHPDVLGPVQEILGPDILCWTTNVFLKEPHDPAFVSWHQDSRYWNLDPPEVVTAWVALAPSTAASGWLKVIPGSHLWEDQRHADVFDRDNQLTRGQSIQGLDEATAVGLALRPGQMSLHHIRLVHGSDPNRSDAPRIGLAIRYASTRVAPTGRRESALLVSGTDPRRHFVPEQRPTGEFSLAGQIAHNRALRLQVPNNYRPHGPTSWRDRLRLNLLGRLSALVLDTLHFGLGVRAFLTRIP